jgi:hypothetical protein
LSELLLWLLILLVIFVEQVDKNKKNFLVKNTFLIKHKKSPSGMEELDI